MIERIGAFTDEQWAELVAGEDDPFGVSDDEKGST
jgi:hypothetical protein